jgi:hypothetical protein
MHRTYFKLGGLGVSMKKAAKEEMEHHLKKARNLIAFRKEKEVKKWKKGGRW